MCRTCNVCVCPVYGVTLGIDCVGCACGQGAHVWRSVFENLLCACVLGKGMYVGAGFVYVYLGVWWDVGCALSVCVCVGCRVWKQSSR